MARVTLTPIAIPSKYSIVPVLMTFTAWTADMCQFIATGREILVAKNVHLTVAKTVTVTSVADEMGRTSDIAAISVAALTQKVFPFFALDGWKQIDGMIYLTAEDTNIQFCVMTLPS